MEVNIFILKSRAGFFLLSILTALFILQAVYCHGFEQVAVSARALSLGNAVTAYSPGVMSIHYNPAGLTRLQDKEFTFGVTALTSIRIKSKFDADPDYDNELIEETDPLAGTTGTARDGTMYYPIGGTASFMAVPNMGVSHRKPGSKWTIAFGMYAPYMMGFTRDSDDPARYGGAEIYNQRFIYAGPALGYRATDTLSFGFSIGLGQTARGLKQEIRAPNEIVSITDVLGEATEGLEVPIVSELTLPEPWFNGGLPTYGTLAELDMELRDDLDTSFNFGMLWEPFKFISFGACYQSEAKSEPSGKYKFKYSKRFQEFCDWFGESPLTVQIAAIFNMPFVGIPQQKGIVTLKKAINPQRAQFGVMLKPFEWIRLMCDIGWTNWSAINKEVYRFDQDIKLFQVLSVAGYDKGRRAYVVERNFENTWNLCYGAEIKPFNWLSLRFGYEDRETYVRDRYFDMSMPMQDMKIYSGGIGLQIGAGWSVDIAGSYMESDKTYTNEYKEGNIMNSEEFFFTGHNPYTGLDYEQDMHVSLVGLNINYVW